MRIVLLPLLLLFSVTVGCGGPGTSENPEEPESEKEEVEEEPEPEAYLGGWLKAVCADDIDGTGNKEGDIAEDFLQLEQNGEMLRLHDFCDRTVWLVGSAFW